MSTFTFTRKAITTPAASAPSRAPAKPEGKASANLAQRLQRLRKLHKPTVNTKTIAIFFRQFSVMIDAGLPLVQCLEILAANQENAAFQECLNGVRTSVEEGATLANAMRRYPTVFDDLSTNMIEAGETGGISISFCSVWHNTWKRRLSCVRRSSRR
jgi:type II secretory pathway component PulF